MFISHYVRARVGPHIYGLCMKYALYIHGVPAADVRGDGTESKRRHARIFFAPHTRERENLGEMCLDEI